jgi:general secretion pathway protein K
MKSIHASRSSSDTSRLKSERVQRRVRQVLGRSRARKNAPKRGVALLMVMGTLTVLTVMLTEFQDSTSAELGSSVSARDQIKAEYAARSAVNLTRLLLAAEPTIRGPLALLTQGAQIPVWEYTDVILGAFNDADGGAVFEGMSGMRLQDGRNLGLEGARFSLVVVDEDSKLNLNQAARADLFSQKRMAEQIISMIGGVQYNQFFEESQDDKGNILDRVTVCSALIDWADPDADKSACDPRAETATAAAPEDSYYQLLDKPFARKNAAFDSLEELHLVQGVTDEFWRTFLFPDPDDEKSRVVTVWGAGKVNVNSANARTLLAVVCHQSKPETPLCTDPLMQQKYLMTTQMFSQFTAGMPLFSSPKAFVNAVQGKGMFGELLVSMGITPVELLSPQLMEDSVTTESKVFSIYATGHVNSGKKETRSRIHAVVDMRDVPPPGTVEEAAKVSQLQRMQADPTNEPAGPKIDLPEEFEEGGLVRALVPRPGGSILYYRVD